MQVSLDGEPRTAATPLSFAFVVVTTSLAFFVTQLDVTIVNVALPRMGQDLAARPGALQWVVDAYTLPLAVAMLSAGALGDRLGIRRCFRLGLTLFGCTSLACALAPSILWLNLARVAQGVGAAAMLPNSLALLNHAFSHDAARRAKAVGWWTAAGAASLAMGPILGGLLVSSLGWRWIFYVNLPLCALGLILASRLPESSAQGEFKGIDAMGQLCAAAGLTLLTTGIIQLGHRGLMQPPVWGCLAGSVLCGALFVFVERRSRNPVLPGSLFSNRAFLPAVGFGMVMNFTYYGSIFLFSIFLQKALGYSPLGTGLAFLPLTAGFILSNVVSGPVTTRFGPRLPMILGSCLDAAGFALLLRVGVHSGYRDLALGFLLIPMGMGLGVPAMTTVILSSTEKRLSATASAVLNTARQAAGAIGVAVLGARVQGDLEDITRAVHGSALLCVLILLAALALALRMPRRPALAH